MIETEKEKAVTPSRHPQSKVMSLSEACDYIGVAKQTMYKYLTEGTIKGFKYQNSRVWKFDRDDLDQWIELQKTRSQQ